MRIQRAQNPTLTLMLRLKTYELSQTLSNAAIAATDAIRWYYVIPSYLLNSHVSIAHVSIASHVAPMPPSVRSCTNDRLIAGGPQRGRGHFGGPAGPRALTTSQDLASPPQKPLEYNQRVYPRFPQRSNAIPKNSKTPAPVLRDPKICA